MRKKKTHAGFSVIEILVALGIFSIVMLGLSKSLVTALQTLGAQEVKLGTVQDTRGTLEVMSRDIRYAGYDPLEFGACGRVEVAESDCMAFESDMNIDGDCDDEGERLVYYMASGAIRRKANSDLACSGGELLVAAESGGAVNLAFAYFDVGGTDLGAPPADLSQIQQVDVALSIAMPNPDPLRGSDTISTALTTRVNLLN